MAYYHTEGNGLRAILSGNVDWIKELSNCGKPPIVAMPNPDFSGDEVIDSYKAICILDEALKGYPEYNSLNVARMLIEHNKIFPDLPNIDYSVSDCVCYNDAPWFEDEQYEELINQGVRRMDVDLSNAIIMHKEAEVVRLLNNGATPFFLTVRDYLTCISDYYYDDVAPSLGLLDTDIGFWWTEVPIKFPDSIMSMTDDELCNTIFALYNIAAHRHILQVVDNNILPEVKSRGEEFVQRMCGG